nr:hypothetical protein Iba_chr11fCG9880 [Ipomoea batatas]
MVKDRENASRYPVLGTKDNRGFCSTISDDQEDQVGEATSTGESPATEVGTGGVRRDGGLVHGKARTGVGEEFTSGTTTWSGIGGAFTGGSSAIASISAKKSRMRKTKRVRLTARLRPRLAGRMSWKEGWEIDALGWMDGRVGKKAGRSRFSDQMTGCVRKEG